MTFSTVSLPTGAREGDLAGQDTPLRTVLSLATTAGVPTSASDAAVPGPAPLRLATTELGFRVACYAVPITSVPADFFADPDGQWTFEALVQAAGFTAEQGVAIGALRAPFNGHPDGAAVVTLNAESRPYVAIVECPIAFVYADGASQQRVSAA